MYAKFLVRNFSTPSQLDRLLHHTISRSFRSTCSMRRYSSSSQIITPRIAMPVPTPVTPGQSLIVPGKFNKAFRKVHANAWLMNESDGAAPENNSTMTYCIVPREKSDIVSQFLIHYYHNLEPISVALGMPIEEIGDWFRRFIRMAMFASVVDVSVQAIDEKSRKRVGVLSSIIIDPRVKAPTHKSSFLDPESHPVNMVMHEFYEKLEQGLAEARYEGTSNGHKVKTLEHMFISVNPSHSGQGISHKMVGLSESIAATVINCKIGYVVTTSEYSYKVFKSHGYEVVREINYADYVDPKGEKIFADKMDKLQPHTTCRAMVKKFKCHFE